MEKQRITELLERGSFDCKCGRHHDAKIKDVFISSGAISNIPAMLEKYGYTLEGKKKIAEELGISLRTLYRRISHLQDGAGHE